MTDQTDRLPFDQATMADLQGWLMAHQVTEVRVTRRRLVGWIAHVTCETERVGYWRAGSTPLEALWWTLVVVADADPAPRLPFPWGPPPG